MSLHAALVSGNGLVGRGEVADRLIDGGVRRGELVRIFPRVFVEPWLADDPTTRRRAALRYAGGRAALSHLSALAQHGVHTATAGNQVHLTVDASVRLAGAPGLVVHRRTGLSLEPPVVVWRDELPVVPVDRAIVESWPLLRPLDRRAPAIVSVRERRTTPARLRAAVDQMPRLPGRAELAALIGLLAAGLHSPLEIWGHSHVFDHPSLPLARPQRRVSAGGRTAYLDRAYLEELVDVELDGATYHSCGADVERDRRRDAWLAALGWLVVRYSRQRLLAGPDAVRAELREVLATRRRQLAD